MKRIFFAAITGTNDNRQMGEIMEAPFGEQWDGDVAAYLENMDEVPTYMEGNEHIPGDIVQNFGGMNPENICIVFDGDPKEIWWSAE